MKTPEELAAIEAEQCRLIQEYLDKYKHAFRCKRWRDTHKEPKAA